MSGKIFAGTAFLTVMLLLTWALRSSSAPVKQTRQTAEFLLRFGYIQLNDTDNGREVPDVNSPQFKVSLRSLQRFGNIPVTGRMDAATIALINTDRCGVKDPQSNAAIGRFNLQGTKWKKRLLTYRILNFTKDGIPDSVQRRIFYKSFHLWQSAAGIDIRECDECREADILISFVQRRHVDRYPFDGQGGTLAHAFYPLSNKGLSGDAHFDDDERFTTGTSDGVNLDWVAVHEFGHSLGLEHSSVRESIMYPWYKGYQGPNIELTQDDIQGIRALYGPKPTVRLLTAPTARTTPKAETTRRPRITTPSTSRPRVSTPSTRRPRVSTPTPRPLCNSSIRYDTVFVGPDRWTYFLVGDKFWMVSKRLRRDGPWLIKQVWKEIETPVDAAYLNSQNHVVFFKGSMFWEYDYKQKLLRSGQINNYGNRAFNGYITNIDAVFIWERNSQTYFFKGNKYWKYDDRTRRVYTYGYPRDIQRAWKFPGKIRAAVKWMNGRNYVFWDTTYTKMDKGKVGKAAGYPQDIANRWMRCNSKGRDLFPEDP